MNWLRITLLLAAYLMALSTAWGASPESPSVYSYDAKSHESVYRTPEDVLPQIPVLNLIPRRFLLDRYTVGLNINDIQVDHHAASRSTLHPQNFWVGMSYAQPMGSDSLSSRIDVPLLSSERIGAPWARAEMGDYELHFLHSPMGYSGLRLMANAKFN